MRHYEDWKAINDLSIHELTHMTVLCLNGKSTIFIDYINHLISVCPEVPVKCWKWDYSIIWRILLCRFVKLQKMDQVKDLEFIAYQHSKYTIKYKK